MPPANDHNAGFVIHHHRIGRCALDRLCTVDRSTKLWSGFRHEVRALGFLADGGHYLTLNCTADPLELPNRIHCVNGNLGETERARQAPPSRMLRATGVLRENLEDRP